MLKIFITGTDTGIGKTYITAEILKFFAAQNLKVAGIKPVASGCYQYNNVLLNEDAVLLQTESSFQLSYDQVNPFRFLPSIAPHIADKQNVLNVEAIYNKYQEVLKNDLDVLLVEGVGGWCTPLNYKETMADFVQKAGLGVVLVVGMKLGCLNHSVLTVQSILARNIKIYGWVANCVNKTMEELSANVETLEKILPIPFLGDVPYSEKISKKSKFAHRLSSLRECSFSA